MLQKIWQLLQFHDLSKLYLCCRRFDNCYSFMTWVSSIYVLAICLFFLDLKVEKITWQTLFRIFLYIAAKSNVVLKAFAQNKLEREENNASVLNELGVKRELLGKIATLKMGYFGHILRGSGSTLTLQIIEGMMDGKRRRGRQKKQWFDNIREQSRMSIPKPSA